MKKRTLLLVFVLCVAASHAQFLKLMYNNTDVTNKVHFISFDISTIQGFSTYFSVINPGTTKFEVVVKKSIQAGDTVAGTFSTFAWGTFYPPGIYESFPHAVKDSSRFEAVFFPEGKPGTNKITYIFYNNVNKNDSIWITLIYNPVIGIKDRFPDKLTVFPNPADKLLYLDLPSNSSAVTIELRDLTGKLFRNQHSKQEIKNGRFSFTLEEVPEGIYLVRAYNEHFHRVQKIVVQH